MGTQWNEFTTKDKPADTDELMALDTSGKANKRVKFSGVWDWIVDKMATAVMSKLETQNKTLIGAVNELNSKANGTVIEIGDIELSESGYYNISNNSPKIYNAKNMEIAYYDVIKPASAISTFSGTDGRCFVFGMPKTKVTNLKIRYWK